jgi:hypothetical protein
MIPPLQLELAQLRQLELQQEAEWHRLVRQANRTAARPALGLPRRDAFFSRKLWWLALRMSGASYADRT